MKGHSFSLLFLSLFLLVILPLQDAFLSLPKSKLIKRYEFFGHGSQAIAGNYTTHTMMHILQCALKCSSQGCLAWTWNEGLAECRICYLVQLRENNILEEAVETYVSLSGTTSIMNTTATSWNQAARICEERGLRMFFNAGKEEFRLLYQITKKYRMFWGLYRHDNSSNWLYHGTDEAYSGTLRFKEGISTDGNCLITKWNSLEIVPCDSLQVNMAITCYKD